jgi:hypothetical protein
LGTIVIHSQRSSCPAIFSHFQECKISTVPCKIRKSKLKYQSEKRKGGGRRREEDRLEEEMLRDRHGGGRQGKKTGGKIEFFFIP